MEPLYIKKGESNKKGEKSMKKKEETERKKLGIWIPNIEIYRRFLAKVAEKHGKTYGKTGEEIINALLLWMEHEEVKEEEETAPGGGEIKKVKHTHTHLTEEEIKEFKEIEGENIAYAKVDEKYAKRYPLNSRERRLGEIGKMLHSTQISSLKRGKAFLISYKGLQRLVTMQKVSDNRVIEGYIATMELRGWIQRESKTTYSILPMIISEDLDLHIDGEYLKKLIYEEKPREVKPEDTQIPGPTLPAE